MYDISKRKVFQGATVQEIIDILSKLNPEAEFLCDGDSYFYLHVEKDDSVVNLDSSSLNSMYLDSDSI